MPARPLAILLCSLAAHVGCGGVVTTEPGGGGAAGGTATSSLIDPGTTSSTSITTTTTTPPLPDPGVRLAQGARPYCLKNPSGTVTCHKESESIGGPGPLDLPAITDAVAVVRSLEQGCVLHAGGAVSCWGYSHYGQLGTAVPVGSSSDVPVILPGVSVTRLSSGHHAVCGIEPSGQAICWGGAYSGPLGDPAVTKSQSPVAVLGVDDAVEIGVFFEHGCAIRAGGSVSCWGVGEAPQEVSGLGGARGLSVGEPQACVIVEGGEVVCWIPGEPGLVTIPGLDDVVQVSANFDRTCARRAGGEVACWISIGSPDVVLEEMPIDDAVDVAALSNSGVACAVRSSGEAVCWVPLGGGLVAFPG